MLQPELISVVLDVATEGVSSKTIIYVLASVVATLAGVIASMGLHIAKSSKSSQKKLDELYEARINDLKETHDLVDTLMDVVKLGKR